MAAANPWKERIAVAVITMFISAVGAGIGWSFVDRIHWAANEKQIQVNTEHLGKVDKKLDELPSAYISRQEHEAIEKKSEEQHRETMDGIRHLENRIDQWMKEQRRGQLQQNLLHPERGPMEVVSRK